MSDFRTIDAEKVEGKRVLVRVDLNVPMKAGKVTDATRIERAAPTLSELASKGAATRPDAHLIPREPRIRIIRATLLHYQGRVLGARLRNISSGGALVECREEMPVGAEIQLDFAAGGLIAAEIRWTKGTQFGVQFREKFNLKLLQPGKPLSGGNAHGSQVA